MAVRTHADKRRALLEKLLDKAAKMRAVQKGYFATKSPGLLHESRALERDLDAILLEIAQVERLMGGEVSAQVSLFDNGD